MLKDSLQAVEAAMVDVEQAKAELDAANKALAGATAAANKLVMDAKSVVAGTEQKWNKAAESARASQEKLQADLAALMPPVRHRI